MKKIVLSIAGVMAATAFAPEASAIPAFARQTGMACTACHQQHFPILNGFGMAFKAAGYTMMGAQGKVEGDHLSIPDTLNASMLLKARYQKNTDNVAGAVTTAVNNSNNGQWQIPDEFSLFFAGRIAENIGFFFEGNTAASMLVAGFKMPVVFDMGGAKLSVTPYLTDALGAAYGFELSATGAVRNVRWAEHRKDISAQQYIINDSTRAAAVNPGGAASGIALVAQNDMGYINYSLWSPVGNLANPGARGVTPKLDSSYLRIAATPNVGDWAMHIGAQLWRGKSSDGAQMWQTKADALDFQAHGQVGGKELGVYATYAKAAADDATIVVAAPASGNYFVGDRKAWTIGADYSVIPHILHLGAAYRKGVRAAGANQDDNSVTLMGVYDLTQNVALHVNHSMRSGSFHSAPAVGTNDRETTFLLEAAW